MRLIIEDLSASEIELFLDFVRGNATEESFANFTEAQNYHIPPFYLSYTSFWNHDEVIVKPRG
jgi:hypothetical protein